MKSYPLAYINFLVEFHGTRDYFECHEILEEYWKENNEKKWVALIQLAVAVYHERQKNFNGSLRLYRKVLVHLRNYTSEFEDLSLRVDDLIQIIRSRIKNILEEGSYMPLNLPLLDDLVQICQHRCLEIGVDWCSIEDIEDDNLIYRHRLRDRSEVIDERLESLRKKESERNKG